MGLKILARRVNEYVANIWYDAGRLDATRFNRVLPALGEFMRAGKVLEDALLAESEKWPPDDESGSR